MEFLGRRGRMIGATPARNRDSIIVLSGRTNRFQRDYLRQSFCRASGPESPVDILCPPFEETIDDRGRTVLGDVGSLSLLL